MKTLVLFGSAREKGNTKALVNAFLEELEGEIEIVDAYRTSVQPCKDCRYCWHKRGCSIKDGMQEIYKKVDEADNIILAAPIYFHTIPGPMKVLVDRFQVYWAGEIRKDRPEKNSKKGAILMVGGAPTYENHFLAGEIVLKALLKDVAAECVGVITKTNTDKDPVSEDEEVKAKAKELAKLFK